MSPDPSEPAPVSTPSKSLPDLSATVPGVGVETTVTGTVREGVEAGCILVEDYLLVGAPASVAVGQRVTVTGRTDPNIVTTCQQGTPLVVSSVKPA